jgi:amidase
VPVEIREARTDAEVEAAGRVTVAANAEFAPADPDGRFAPSWRRYLAEMADAATRAAEGVLLVAVEDGRVVGTVTLYLRPGSMQWRRDDAMFRLLAVDPAARGRGIGRALLQACLDRARAAGKRRMALHTTEWMPVARAMYERAGFTREPEGDEELPGVTIIAYAAELGPAAPELDPPVVGGRTPVDARTHHPTGGADMHEILFQPAAEAARRLRRRELSSRELTEALLARIDAVNPRLNAVVALRADQALREAAAADEAAAAGGRLGPLHGVPMTVKDSFDVAGLPTTWGNPAFKDHVAAGDATVVRRLREAGAVVVGKTNVAFMLSDFGQTANELHGVTGNPWDPARAPGGSSGGSAAAVAAGLSFLEYGSDLVGSIRLPASYCGVYGLRPSVGVVPLTGFQPPGPPAGPSDMTYLAAVGPLARSAEDLSTALAVTAGPEAPAARAYAWSLAPPRHERLAGFRVGVVLDHDQAPVSGEVAAPLADAVDALAQAGATVVEGWPDGVDPVREAESFGFHVRLFFAYQQPPSDDLPAFAEVVGHEHRRMAARAAWTRYFDDVDVFLCPASFTPAFPHDTRPFEARTIATPEGERPYADQAFWVAQAALPGLPAVAAPVGRTAGGLPVGIQVVGPLFEDDTAVTFAGLLAEVAGGYVPPPR